MQYNISGRVESAAEPAGRSGSDWSTLLPLTVIILVFLLSPFLYDLADSLI